jgi:hypothetical protein
VSKKCVLTLVLALLLGFAPTARAGNVQSGAAAAYKDFTTTQSYAQSAYQATGSSNCYYAYLYAYYAAYLANIAANDPNDSDAATYAGYAAYIGSYAVFYLAEDFPTYASFSSAAGDIVNGMVYGAFGVWVASTAAKSN